MTFAELQSTDEVTRLC